jgi:hypothetical protein
LQFTRPSESPMTARAPPTSACHQCDQLFLGQHQRLTAKLRFPTRLHRKDRLRCQAWPRPTPHLTARPRRLTVRERESHRYYRPDRHRQNLVGLCLWPAKPRASIIPCPIYECRAPRWPLPAPNSLVSNYWSSTIGHPQPQRSGTPGSLGNLRGALRAENPL